MKPFSPKTPGEIVALGFDFSELLGSGETVTSATWYAEELDDTPASQIVSGLPTVASPIVKQLVVGGTLGACYRHVCSATTSAGQVLVLANTQRIMKPGESNAQ